MKKILVCIIVCMVTICAFACKPNDHTEEYKTKLLTLFEQLQTAESYTETAEITGVADGITTAMKITSKFQKRGDGHIAEGLTKIDGMLGSFYYTDGYMYMPVAYEPQFIGVKVSLPQRDLISFSGFFAENSGYLTAETINGLSKESNFKTETAEGNTVYSFATEAWNFNGLMLIHSGYRITVETLSGRISEIKQVCSSQFNGQTATAEIISKYDYTAVTVNLPDNLDAYLEYSG